MFRIECPDLDKTISRLNSFPENANKAIKRGLYAFGEEVKTEAKRVVPVNLGTLRGTIDSTLDKKIGMNELTIGAGGPAAPYALAVHEHLSEYSPPSWRKARTIHWKTPGTGPKFIERPLTQKLKNLDNSIAGEIDRAVQEILF